MGLLQEIGRTFGLRLGQLIDVFYISPLRRAVPHQIFRYAACGGLNMVQDTLLYYFVYHYVIAERVVNLGFIAISPYVASMIVIFPVTFFVGFWLNRNVAFRRSHIRRGVQLLRYALSVGGSILLSYVLLKLFVEVCGLWPTPSKLLTTILVAVYSFLAAKYFTFATKQHHKPPQVK